MWIDIRQIVLVIASAADLVGVEDVMHGRRIGVMTVECARHLGWDRETQNLLFDAALVHDCGVSSTRLHRLLSDDLDRKGAQVHCKRGSALLRGFAPLARLAPIVRYHHTHWDELARLPLPPTTARYANLIYLANWVDVTAAPHYGDNSLLLHVEELRAMIARGRGTLFAPDLVDAFLEASRAEAFWLPLTPDFIHQYVAEMGCFTQKQPVSIAELKQFALIIAAIVDAKSRFTADHSRGVGRLARFLGKKAGIDGRRLDMIEVAALLHDIGKLQIPDELLENRRPELSPAEQALIRKHSFATYQILKRISGFDELARWASQHHESPSGGGYPFRMFNGEIPLESRIVKVADIYQALAQDRPYQKARGAAEILVVLRALQEKDELDAMLVDIVAQNLKECHAAAAGPAA